MPQTDDFDRAARALHAAGSGGFADDLEASVKKAEEKTAQRMHAAIGGSLPRSGGLAARVSEATDLTVRGTTGLGDYVVVRTTAESRYNLAAMNAGTVLHPVYGSETWVSQTEGVRQGFLDEAHRHGDAERRRAADDAVKATAATIDRSVE